MLRDELSMKANGNNKTRMNGFVSFADKFYTYVVIENVGPRNIRFFLLPYLFLFKFLLFSLEWG